jgi:hypothetical protein
VPDHRAEPSTPIDPAGALFRSGGEAFAYVASQLADLHDRWRMGGAPAEALDWAMNLATLAGWWGGRLEAEADWASTGRCQRRRRRA